MTRNDSSRSADAWKKLSFGSIRRGGSVMGLVADVPFATQIAKAASRLQLKVRNFDRAEALVTCARQSAPVLVILDFDGREAEAFELLKGFAASPDLKNFPTVGVVSQSKAALKEEAQRAGCHRVFGKAEFSRSLDDILMRYAI